MKKFLMLLVLAALAGTLGACATGISVQVSAIAEPGAPSGGSRYYLVNGNSGGNEDDLFFREFSAYFVPILAGKGYQRVDSVKKADLKIRFQYAVSEGRTGISTFTRPIYVLAGGETINYVQTKTDANGQTTTTRSTVDIPMRERYVGSRVERRSYTLFTSSVILEARQLPGATGINKPPRVLWKTMISSTSESNDLRAIMPVMAAAAKPYLAGNSGAQKNLWLKLDAPEVKAVRKTAGQKIEDD